VAQAFFTSAEKLQNMEEPLQMAARIATAEVEENFNAQGRPTGWQPLAEATLARKAFFAMSESQRAGYMEGMGGIFSSAFETLFAGMASDMQILVDSGDLKNGATGGGNWTYRRLSGNEDSIEMNDPTGYGAYHITGTNKMPIRDWSYISSEAVDQMAAFMGEWVISQ
jgi:phage gpG-like protein